MKQCVAQGPRGSVLLMDSITRVEPQDAGSVVVSASHGGTSSGGFALEVPLALVFFNDAGVGKDGAGIAALAMLEQRRIPAACVAHTSARIGDAVDMWENGVVSHANACALQAGIAPGDRVVSAAKRHVGLRYAPGGLSPSGFAGSSASPASGPARAAARATRRGPPPCP